LSNDRSYSWENPPLGRKSRGFYASRKRNGISLKRRFLDFLYPDGRFAFAYNAFLQLATAYLRLHHIRIGSSSHHIRTFQALEDLLPKERQEFALDFDRARRKRHALTYDQAGVVSEHEAQELIEEVNEFREWFLKELTAHFPQYSPDNRR